MLSEYFVTETAAYKKILADSSMSFTQKSENQSDSSDSDDIEKDFREIHQRFEIITQDKLKKSYEDVLREVHCKFLRIRASRKYFLQILCIRYSLLALFKCENSVQLYIFKLLNYIPDKT